MRLQRYKERIIDKEMVIKLGKREVDRDMLEIKVSMLVEAEYITDVRIGRMADYLEKLCGQKPLIYIEGSEDEDGSLLKKRFMGKVTLRKRKMYEFLDFFIRIIKPMLEKENLKIEINYGSGDYFNIKCEGLSTHLQIGEDNYELGEMICIEGYGDIKLEMLGMVER